MFCFHSHIANSFEHDILTTDNINHNSVHHIIIDNIENRNVTYYKQHIEQYLREYDIYTLKQAWKCFNTIDCPWKQSSTFTSTCTRVKTSVNIETFVTTTPNATTVNRPTPAVAMLGQFS